MFGYVFGFFLIYNRISYMGPKIGWLRIFSLHFRQEQRVLLSYGTAWVSKPLETLCQRGSEGLETHNKQSSPLGKLSVREEYSLAGADVS